MPTFRYAFKNSPAAIDETRACQKCRVKKSRAEKAGLLPTLPAGQFHTAETLLKVLYP